MFVAPGLIGKSLADPTPWCGGRLMGRADVIELPFTGAYSLDDSVSLAARAAFVVDKRSQGRDEPKTLPLAFTLEGYWSPVCVAVEQRYGRLPATVLANPDGKSIKRRRWAEASDFANGSTARGARTIMVEE